MIHITFLPQNITVAAHPGDTVLDAALDNGIEMAHECGGNCACTTCHVHVRSGLETLSIMEEVEADRLSTAENRMPNSRLGCQAILQRSGSVMVEIVEMW